MNIIYIYIYIYIDAFYVFESKYDENFVNL
jgi:hypothetical protein